MKPEIFPRAEVSAFLHVEAFGQRRKPCSTTAKLMSIFKNDFRASIVFLDLPANINDAPGKLPHVADMLQIVRKHNYAERTQAVIFTKIQIMDSAISSFDANHFSSDALVFANMFSRLIKRNAFREADGR